MTREGKYCGYCGTLNSKTSHWHADNKRFCTKPHLDAYLGERGRKRPYHENTPPKEQMVSPEDRHRQLTREWLDDMAKHAFPNK